MGEYNLPEKIPNPPSEYLQSRNNDIKCILIEVGDRYSL